MLAVLKPARRFALFAALWAFGLIAAYSLIAYKTPWLSLNFVVPLALAVVPRFNGFMRSCGNGSHKHLRVYTLIIVLVMVTGILPGTS